MAKKKFTLGVIGPCRRRDRDPKRPMSAQRVCLFTKTKPRRLLGRHPNRQKAFLQEYAIKMRQRGG